jgi:AcrR family transcriptional regulator
VPRLWSETIETHRHVVRDATLDAAAEVVSRRGLAAATMSEIAEKAGIARATLYKYFPDVESIMIAWHERQVSHHLSQLEQVRDDTVGGRRLEVVLETYALNRRDRAGSALAPLLHPPPGREPAGGDDHLAKAHEHLTGLVAELIGERVRDGTIRGDIPAIELAGYCLHALSAAESLSSVAAVRRLCAVVLSGLQPPS